ncbi:MAG: bifunctional diguanylate cyclase/phosphohydrolase [Solirubrobacterales bacterium]
MDIRAWAVRVGGGSSLRQRLSWSRIRDTEAPASDNRGVMARTFAYMFGLGATLLLATLALPHAPDRETVPLVLTAFAAYLATALFLFFFDRLPRRLLVLAPGLASVLVGVVMYFGGAEATGAYAMYLLWVAISAAYFFGFRFAIAHIAFAIACYGLVLAVRPEIQLPALLLVMAAGALLVGGVLVVTLRWQAQRLADVAGTDALTGLSNRREFDENFVRELERSTRSGKPLGLAVLDLDFFKEVNDVLGHAAGDRALRKLADVLRSETRAVDTVARLGGEEFAVLAPEAGEEGTLLLAERLREKVKAAFAGDAKPLTISCGIASFPATGGTAADVVRAADRALYSAKDLGRDRSVVYRADESETAGAEAQEARPGRANRLPALVALAEAMDQRKGSPSHSRLVGRYAEALAQELGLSEAEVERVGLAGLLHDIGTVGISESTLTKKGPLSAEEWAEIRKHPEIGARIVGTASLEGVGEMIIAHHERPDGEGYPFGLKLEEIPIGAQIVAIADAYAAMTATRSYRDDVDSATALDELEAQSGTQFAPELVDAFVSLDGQLQRGLEGSSGGERQRGGASERSAAERLPRNSTK